VLSHARALLPGSPEGETAYIEADLRNVGSIMEGAAGLLDFGRPATVVTRAA
jgi:hypothetical protein